jgi:hypothetical protein
MVPLERDSLGNVQIDGKRLKTGPGCGGRCVIPATNESKTMTDGMLDAHVRSVQSITIPSHNGYHVD